MKLNLLGNDEALLRGREGPAAQLAMSIVTQMAEYVDIAVSGKIERDEGMRES